MTFQRETDLARIVAEHYRRNGARVWAEVEVPGLNERPDLVVVDARGLLAVIETKLTLSFHSVSQAAQWWDYANWALLIVPHAPRLAADTREADLIRRICKAERIGLVVVTGSGAFVPVVPATLRAQPVDIGILDALQRLPEYDPATATVHPGSPGKPEKPELVKARVWLANTVYQWERRRIKFYSQTLEANFNERIARQVIAQAKAGKVDGVRAERLGGLWFLGPAEEQEEVA